MGDEDLLADEGDVLDETEGFEAAPEEDMDEGIEATEFTPEFSTKPKSDIYTMLLILTFVAFLTGIMIAGKELYDNYDVMFWVLSKE